MEKTQRIAVLVIAVVAGAVGPRVVSKKSHPAGAPFEYLPPPGFQEEKPHDDADDDDGAGAPAPVSDSQRAWVPTGPRALAPRVKILLTHSANESTVEEGDLARLAAGMPSEYRAKGLQWTEVHHEMVARADGAHVGVLEGELVPIDGGKPLRSLQLAFPDDAGLSIVSASFPVVDEPTWGPAMRRTIDTAKGVAVRLPPPPTWMAFAFAVGGAVVGGALMTVLDRAMRPRPRAPIGAGGDAPERGDAEDEGAEDEGADDEEDPPASGPQSRRGDA